MAGHSFKQLDSNNWLLPDLDSLAYSFITLDGITLEKKSDKWIKEILSPQLSDGVPSEIKRLYEVARGTLVYGFLYFPIYTLAAEQLFRVAETAISLKCSVLNSPNQIKTFEKKLIWLRDKGALSDKEERTWQKIRRYRNASSHLDDQEIFPPGWAVDFLTFITTRINELFQ